MATSNFHQLDKDPAPDPNLSNVQLALSLDDFDSIADSDGPTSSIIRLPQVQPLTPLTFPIISTETATATATATTPQSLPPPLPPKPSFARSKTIEQLLARRNNNNSNNNNNNNSSSNSNNNQIIKSYSTTPAPLTQPPPLPPKPERLVSGPAPTTRQPSQRRAQLKRSFEEDGSWALSILDDLSFIDATFPVEHLLHFNPYVQQQHQHQLQHHQQYRHPLETAVADAEFYSTASVTIIGTTLLSDRFASLHLPFPPPPFAVTDRAICAALFPLHTPPKQAVLRLSVESTEDVNIGAIVLTRSRQKSQHPTSSSTGAAAATTTAAGNPPQPIPENPPSRPTLVNSHSVPQHLSAITTSGTTSVAKSTGPPTSSSSPVHFSTTNTSNAQNEEDVWSVLRDYLTNTSLGPQGRARALQTLAIAVVRACDDDDDDDGNGNGHAMLTEIVRRMRGAERSERDGSVFTLLVNVSAADDEGTAVERVTHRVFSMVVEEMHGRQDDKVMWERALRCFIILLKTSQQHQQYYYDQLNFTLSHDISTKCVMALALHVGDVAHADIDHVLIANSLCPRLRLRDIISPSASSATAITNTFTTVTSSSSSSLLPLIDQRVLLDIGGIDAVTSLVVDTASVSARHVLFGVIFDVAVTNAVEELKKTENNKSGKDTAVPGGAPTSNDDNIDVVLNDQITALRSFFHAYDMADLLVHTFRIGPWDTFVTDVLRMLLMQPLTHELFPLPSMSFPPSSSSSAVAVPLSSDSKDGDIQQQQHSQQHDQQQHHQQQNPEQKQQEQQQEQEKTQTQQQQEQQSFSGGFDHKLSLDDENNSDDGAVPTHFQTSTAAYLSAVTIMLKHLDKRLFLLTLRYLQRMATSQAILHDRREVMHHPREWRLLKSLEGKIQDLCSYSAARHQETANSNNGTMSNNVNSTSTGPGYQSLYQQQQLQQQQHQQQVQQRLDAVIAHMHDCVLKLTTERASLRALVRMVELVIEFFTVRSPYASHAEGKLYGGIHFPYHLELHDSVARLFLRGYVVAIRALLHRAPPDLFTALLVASKPQTSAKRVSENRQCLVEFLGISKERAALLNEFIDDDDAAVAYRAREIASGYSDSNHVRSRSLTTYDEGD